MAERDRKFDLAERTTKFGINIIRFAKKIPRNAVSVSVISQLVRAGTSIGANYAEADCAETKKDFEHKIGICKKESRETIYWLIMIEEVAPQLLLEIEVLRKEASELHLIFVSIVKSSRHSSAPPISN